MTESVQNALSGTDLTTKENPIEIAFANKKNENSFRTLRVAVAGRRRCGLAPVFSI